MSVFKLGLFSNRWLHLAVLSSVLMMIAVIYIHSLGEAFHTVPVGAGNWLVAAGIGAGAFLLLEVAKWLPQRRRVAVAPPA